MSKLYFLAKMQIQLKLAYKMDVLVTVLGKFIIMSIMIFVWIAAYSGPTEEKIVSLQDMITFTILSVILNTMFSTSVYRKINDGIVSGSIEVDVFRPVNLVFRFFAEDVGSSIGSLIMEVPLILIFCCVFQQFPYSHSFVSLILFGVSSLFSFLILWLIYALVALLAFWTMELGHLINVVGALIQILSGSMVPLWFFPAGFQKVMQFLTFQYIYQTPLSIYLGIIEGWDCLIIFLVQIFWIFVFIALLCMVYNKAKKRLIVQGG